MVAYKFEDIPFETPRKPHRPLGDLRFRQLFTAQKWAELPSPVRTRFGRKVGPGEAIVYRGTVAHNHLNRWGRFFANAMRLIGAPLPLDTQNTGAAAIVTVTEGANGGQIWMRQYGCHAGGATFPQIIQSAKRFTGATGIEEHIGRGIGMSLRACVEDSELVFHAEDIFWQKGRVRVRLPKWLGPDDLRAGHEELGHNTFAFTLRITHRWFGEMLDQRVVFRDDCEIIQ